MIVRRFAPVALTLGWLLLAPLAPSATAQSAATVSAASGAPAAAPKPITLDDYPRFKRIGGASISPDGKWMLHTVTPNEGDGTLFIKALDGPASFEIPRGTGASFSENARWVAYFVNPPSGGRGGRGGGRGAAPAQGRGGAGQQAAGAQPAVRVLEVLELATGSKTPIPGVSSFSYSPDGNWLLLRPVAAGAAPAAEAGGGGGGGGAPPRWSRGRRRTWRSWH
jgi:hypothetical protein